MNDLLYALRIMRKAPLFTAAVAEDAPSAEGLLLSRIAVVQWQTISFPEFP
jgi:hypothetical protein